MNEVFVPKNHHYYKVMEQFECKLYDNYETLKILSKLLKQRPYSIDWESLPLQFDTNGKDYYSLVIPEGTIFEFRCNSSTRIGWRVYKKYNKDSTLKPCIIYDRLNGLKIEEVKKESLC